MEKLRIGIVGAGFIGKKHVPAWESVKNADVVAVADSDDEKRTALAEAAGAPGYSDLDTMIAEANLDVLDVCLPSKLHKLAVDRAFAAGLDAVVEKPFAISLEDIDAMIRSSAKTGRRLMVAHVCRFKPEYMFVKDLIDSGKMGAARSFTAWRESATPDWSWNGWLLDRTESGGTVMDLSIHDLDISNWFFGRPTEVTAREVTRDSSGGPAHVVSRLSYESGAYSSIEASHLMPDTYPFTTGFRLLFERGVVECEFREGEHAYVEVFNEDGREKKDFSELPPICGDNAYAEELNHFTEAVIDGTDFKITLSDARLAVETAIRLNATLDSASTT